MQKERKVLYLSNQLQKISEAAEPGFCPLWWGGSSWGFVERRCSTPKPSRRARQAVRAELWIIRVQKLVINMPKWVLAGDASPRGSAERTMGCDELLFSVSVQQQHRMGCD